MKKVSFKTLGCRLNQYETDALVTRFHQAGYQVVDYSDPADITVINTCTVTNQSDQKSRNTINQAARKNPAGMVVVTGCMANNHKEQLEANEKITYVVDNERKSQIVSLVDAHFKEKWSIRKLILEMYLDLKRSTRVCIHEPPLKFRMVVIISVPTA